jgi:Porin subfamily
MKKQTLGLSAAFFSLCASFSLCAGAHAADMVMDMKAPREPVYRCDIVGFIELPGTDVCFKIGGYAALELYAVEDQWPPSIGAAYGIIPDGHTLEDTFGMYAFAHVNFDARTQTEYGTVRAFVEAELKDNDTRTGGALELRHAFIQFGNWTFGKTWSTFLHLDSSPIYSDVVTVTGDNYMRRNQIRYTQAFANGLSVSVAAEDQTYEYPYALRATGLVGPVAAYSVVNDRNEVPDVVANIRADGDWGNAQIAAALHDNKYRDVNAAGQPTGWTDDKLGWALLGGLMANTPATGEYDYMTLKGIYTNGATQYNQDNFLWTANVVWGNCAYPGSVRDCITDDVTTWSVLASHTHFWTYQIYTTLGAGYQNVRAPMVSYNPFVATLSSDFEMDTYEIFGNISWKPVPLTTFMLDVHYGHVDFNGAGTSGGVFNPFIVDPAAKDSQGAFLVAVDIRRSF